ncbi:MAG TPA: S8 family serine peptidase, partial [Chitinophagales bacterium]|nr:S8 family serine peptidase [Chitinophagales bacterium]
YSTGKKVITTYALNASNGNLGWKKDYPNLNASIDVPTGIHASGNNIWVYGRRTVSDTTRYVTIKYETYEKPTSYGTDPSGDTTYLNNEIIVRFQPKYVNYDFINNKQQVFTNLNDAISDTLFNIIEPIVNPQNMQFTALAVKIFKEFTVADTISISRLGDTVKLKKLWSTLVLTTPEYNSIFSIIDTLNTLDDFIIYAHPNCVGKLHDVPNDFYIADDLQQESLIESATFPDADINMDHAWDIETGEEYIRVGVFDDIIYWAHEDFGDGTFTGSKIFDGYDFSDDLSAELIDNPPSSHATSCAGIIGALRNNDFGIAGIAGGDVAGTGETGVSLYTLGILNAGFWITLADVSNAIALSAIFNPATDLGYGLHIQNHSWGIEVGDITGEGTITEAAILVLRDAVETAFENNCILVAARGNDGDDDLSYPACYADDWVINVGASGTDGAHKTEFNGDNWWESSFGGNVDFIAPGTTQIVAAPINPTFPYSWPITCDVTDANYECFNGTSAAAPHVAGLAALMLSRHNVEQGYGNNLSVEDVENILQNTAIDVVGPHDGGFNYPVGPDPENGFGLIEAT